MISLHQDRGFIHVDEFLKFDVAHEQKEGKTPEDCYSRILLLHELGALIHFDEPMLRDLIILDPDWLAKVRQSCCTDLTLLW